MLPRFSPLPLAVAIAALASLLSLAAHPASASPPLLVAAAPSGNPNDAALEQQRARLVGALPAAVRPKVVQASQSLASNFPAGANPLTAARSTVAAAKNFGTSPTSDQIEALAWVVLLQTYSVLPQTNPQALQSVYSTLSGLLKKITSTASSVVSSLK